MYESPVNVIMGEMQTQIEGDIFKVIQNVGVDVNKEELLKALQYDREQYSKGYKDGYVEAINDFVERLKEEYKPFVGASEYDKMACAMVYRRFDKIAEELKGGSV